MTLDQAKAIIAEYQVTALVMTDLARFEGQTDKLCKDIYGGKEALRRTTELAVAFGKRNGYPVSFVRVDMNKFHDTNEKYGHETADRALQALARAMAGRPYDIVIREGGDEYTAVLLNVDEEGAQRYALGVQQRFADIQSGKITTPEGEFPTMEPQTVTMGIAQLRENSTAASLLVNADDALYVGKQQQRGMVCVYNPEDPLIQKRGADKMSELSNKKPVATTTRTARV